MHRKKIWMLALVALVVLSMGILSFRQPNVSIEGKNSTLSNDTYAVVADEDSQTGDEDLSDEEEAEEEDPDSKEDPSESDTDDQDSDDQDDQDDQQTDGQDEQDADDEADSDDETDSDDQQVTDQDEDDQIADDQDSDDQDISEDEQEDSTQDDKDKKSSDKKDKSSKKNTSKKSNVKKDKKTAPKVDTTKTDSSTDAAPADLDIEVSDSDRNATVSDGSSSLNSASSKKNATSEYAGNLKKKYHVVFSSDFAIIMDEIENEFEYDHKLISKDTLKLRKDQLEKGIVISEEESSGYAKYADEDDDLYRTKQEVKIQKKLKKQEKEDSKEDSDNDDDEDTITESSLIVASYHYTNWTDVLALYVNNQLKAGAKTVRLNKASKDAIAEIFEDMNSVKILDKKDHIAKYTCKTVDNYIKNRHENGKALKSLKKTLKKYTNTDYMMTIATETGSRQLMLESINAQDEERVAKAEKKLKAKKKAGKKVKATKVEPLSDERIAVVLSAQSLKGKIHYFWGGKYNSTGWNEDWGRQQLVTSEGCSDTGEVMPYGLDCSGFVSWSFVNAYDDSDAGLSLGQGTASQWVTSDAVSDKKAQVGDLVFLRVPSSSSINHVGILVGRDKDGNWMAIHCNGSDDTVSIDRAYDVGFRYLRSPMIYDTDEN